MNFKKYLKSAENKQTTGQAIVEYIILFSVLAMGIIIIFGGFNPDNLKLANNQGLTRVFQQGIQGAINQINRGWH